MFFSHDVVFDKKIFASSDTSHIYSSVLAMKSAVSFIPYATSSYEQIGEIITFSHFEEKNLLQNEISLEEGDSILASIDESFAHDNSDDKSIRMGDIDYIWDLNYLHPNINTRYDRLKILDHIIQ